MRILLIAAAVALSPVTSLGEDIKPWGSRDFSSKRIAAHKGAKLPGLVQIDPEEEPYHLTPAVARGVETSGPQGKEAVTVPDWFWSVVSPDMSASSPNRLPKALGVISGSDQPRTADWNALSALVATYGEALQSGAAGSEVSPAFALAVMAVESAGRADVTSKAGAQGLMQLMPATAERFGVHDAFAPDQNIAGGVAYLDFLLRAFGNDPILVLAAYNAGEGAVAKHEGVPPYSETRAYVPKVLETWAMARMFCRVPPDRVTDPCAFSAIDS